MRGLPSVAPLAEVVVELQKDDRLQDFLDVVTAIAAVAGAIGTVGALVYLALGAKDARETVRSTRESAEAAARTADAAQVSAKAAEVSATAARDEATGAWRPMLAVTKATVRWQEPKGDQTEGRHVIFMQIKNIGRGPALALLDELESKKQGYCTFPDSDGRTGFAALMGVDETRTIQRRHHGEKETIFTLRLDYQDLGGKKYASVVNLAQPGVMEAPKPGKDYPLPLLTARFVENEHVVVNNIERLLEEREVRDEDAAVIVQALGTARPPQPQTPPSRP